MASPISVRTVYPPDKIAINGKAPGGAPFRWAEDEKSPDHVAGNMVLSDQMPGGWKQMSGVLARDPRKGYGDLVPYSDMYAYIPGGRKVWEGSLDLIPDVSGDQQSINPGAVGYQAMLEDNKAVVAGYIASDMGMWEQASTIRALQWVEATFKNPTPFSILPDERAGGAPYLQALVPGKIYKPSYHVHFDAGPGILIGAMWFNMSPFGFGTHTSDPNLTAIIEATDDNIFTGVVTLMADASNPGDYALVVGKRVVNFEAYYSFAGEAGVASSEYGYRMKYPQIASQEAWENLPIQGTQPEAGLSYLPRDILACFINHHTQLFANAAEMANSGYQVKQAWYNTPQPAAAIVKDITKYDNYDWFVYRGKQLDYKAPGTYGKRWRSTLKESDLNETGIDAQRLWRDIVVQWTNPGNGKILLAGPPGSGCDVENSLLEITDPQHPAVLANRTRRDILQINVPITSTTAVELGVRFLEEATLIDHSGSATLSGYVMDDKGIFYPASVVKSGDYISVTDSRSNGYRKIINKTYTHSSRQSQIDLDAPATGLEALLERLNASLIPAGVSS